MNRYKLMTTKDTQLSGVLKLDVPLIVHYYEIWP